MSSTGSLTGLLQATGNLTESLLKAGSAVSNQAVSKALADAAPMLVQVLAEMGTSNLLNGLGLPSRTPLTTMCVS